ncbi:type II toxin-antitoxin system ParD family antitoxin [Planktotalea sp.]|uniref:type II toxin-antitoxin system ParD family antitoxin n=1 Tax=Planktotalea sp. TaxID=2029877 RepID=UPI003F6BB252
MATMNVSLPEQMKDWVEAQSKDGTFSNASDYVRHLIRQDRERQRAIAELQAEIDKGINSGPATPFDIDDFKKRARERLESKRSA